MKCVLIFVGVVLLQIITIKCDEKLAQCSLDLLIPEDKLREAKKKSIAGFCRQAKMMKKQGAFDDNYKMNEENLKKTLEKRITDKDKLEEQVKTRMECASKIKDPKNQCAFVAAMNICTNSAIAKKNKSKKENGQNGEEGGESE